MIYQISQITAHVSGCHTDPELTVPITIGTVPFMNNSGLNITEQPRFTPLAPYPDSSFPILPNSTHYPMPMPAPGLPFPTIKPVDPSAPPAPTNEFYSPSAPFIPFDPAAEYTDCGNI